MSSRQHPLPNFTLIYEKKRNKSSKPGPKDGVLQEFSNFPSSNTANLSFRGLLICRLSLMLHLIMQKQTKPKLHHLKVLCITANIFGFVQELVVLFLLALYLCTVSGCTESSFKSRECSISSLLSGLVCLLLWVLHIFSFL